MRLIINIKMVASNRKSMIRAASAASALVMFLLLYWSGFQDVLLAEVYNLPESALARQFPGAAVERKTVYLTQEQRRQLDARLGGPSESRMNTFYVARKNGAVLGYGIFETHTVRTKDETLFIVVDTAGSIRHVELISFFEPEDYRPVQRWLALFLGKTEHDAISPGNDIAAISGASLTSRAVARSVRKVLMLYRFHFGQ